MALLLGAVALLLGHSRAATTGTGSKRRGAKPRRDKPATSSYGATAQLAALAPLHPAGARRLPRAPTATGAIATLLHAIGTVAPVRLRATATTLLHATVIVAPTLGRPVLATVDLSTHEDDTQVLPFLHRPLCPT